MKMAQSNRVLINCRFCSTGFEIKKSRVGRTKYCSKKCFRSDQQKNKKYSNCQQCGDRFHLRHAKKRFCSIECVHKHRGVERKDIVCNTCKKVFNSIKDHGRERKYCSKACFKHNHMPEKTIKCAQCQDPFLSFYSKDKRTGYKIFCSTDCYYLSSKITLICMYCNEHFPAIKSRPVKGYVFCSTKCRGKGLRGDRLYNYKGGRYLGSTGHIYIYDHRLGRYIAEHRIVASKVLCRDLRKSEEPIIHIDGIGTNNEPSNLYVFPTMEEMGKYLNSCEYETKLVSNITPPPKYSGV